MHESSEYCIQLYTDSGSCCGCDYGWNVARFVALLEKSYIDLIAQMHSFDYVARCTLSEHLLVTCIGCLFFSYYLHS